LDNFITKLEESDPASTGQLRDNFDRATEQMVLANMYSSDPVDLLNKGYTQGQIDAIQRGGGLVDGKVPSPSAADQMMRTQIAANLKGVIPSWGNTQLKERIGTFRSFGGATAERIDEVNEQLYQRYYADSGKEIPSNIATFEQARAKQLDDQKEIPALTFVQDRMDSLLLGSANLAQSLLVEDMSVNQNSYYFNGNPAASQLKVEKEFYQRLNLILGSGLETENVNFLLENNRVFDDVRVNRNILTGKIKQSKNEEQVRLINDAILEQNTEGALPTGSSDALITDLAPPTLTTLNRQIKDMDGTGVLSAKGAAVRRVVSLFDAEYDKNPEQAVSKLRELMSTGSRSIEDLPPRIQKLLGDSEKRPFIDMGFTPVSEIPAFQSLLSQPSLKEEGLFADMGKLKAQRKIKSLDSNIAELQRQISGDRVTKNTRAAKIRQQKLDALVEERASLGEAPVVTSDITDILSEKLSLDKGISSASVGKNTKAFKARLEQQDELASALASMPVEARQIAEAIKGVRNIDSVSDKDLKNTLTSAYGAEITNQVLALLSV